MIVQEITANLLVALINGHREMEKATEYWIITEFNWPLTYWLWLAQIECGMPNVRLDFITFHRFKPYLIRSYLFEDVIYYQKWSNQRNNNKNTTISIDVKDLRWTITHSSITQLQGVWECASNDCTHPSQEGKDPLIFQPFNKFSALDVKFKLFNLWIWIVIESYTRKTFTGLGELHTSLFRVPS